MKKKAGGKQRLSAAPARGCGLGESLLAVRTPGRVLNSSLHEGRKKEEEWERDKMRKKGIIFRKIPGGEGGFTVVELLVAIALTALVVGGIFHLYFAVVLSWEKNVARQANYQNLRQAFRELEGDLPYANWVWIGDNWEQRWNDESFPEPGEGAVIYYSFYGERNPGEIRPHFVFNRVWLSPDRTLLFRKSVLLPEQNRTYYINPSPIPLADNLHQVKFSYADETGRMLSIHISAGLEEEERVEHEKIIFLPNVKGYE